MSKDKSTTPRDIGACDEELIALLQARVRAAQDDASLTRARVPGGITDDVAARIAASGGPLNADALTQVFREVISVTTAAYAPLRIAYLGPPGSFTHQACIRHFGHACEMIEQADIRDVFHAVSCDAAEYGVVPVENSNQGSVAHTLDLFVEATVEICGEEFVPVHHAFMSRCAHDEVTKVYSHPMAFPQCRQWISTHLSGIALHETSSTSEAAARAAREEGAGAIGSTLCAEIYGLTVHAEHIEDMTGNTTRFFIISTKPSPRTARSKTSVLFAIADRPGTLYDALVPFRDNGVNLSKIESRPCKRKAWEYNFYIDCAGHASDPPLRAALETLQSRCHFVKVLGSYPIQGSMHEDTTGEAR